MSLYLVTPPPVRPTCIIFSQSHCNSSIGEQRSSDYSGFSRNMINCASVVSRFCAIFVIGLQYGLSLKYESVELRMPGVQPSGDDVYMCTAAQLDPYHEHYIVKYTPHASMQTAHHMLFYACSKPGSKEGAWNCGGMGGDSSKSGPTCDGDQRLIWAWAKNAPDFQMPEGVGIRVGGKTGLHYVVVQIHFSHALKEPDYSGATVYTTMRQMPKEAAVTVLATGGTIKAHSTLHMDMACKMTSGVELHPFGFRTHTHGLGKVVSGYVVRDEKWILIGKHNPQEPQMFYPVEDKQLAIKKGDILAARCTMENHSGHDVQTGGTGHDEMCNFYIMYWVNATEAGKDEGGCGGWDQDLEWGKGPLKNVPADVSSLP